MADYDTLSADEYRAWLEQQGADEADIRAAVEDLGSRR
jgi:hypothetical protein